MNILKNEDFYTILDYTLKQLLVILVKTKNSNLIENSVDLTKFSHEMLKYHKILKHETVAKDSLLLAYLMTRLPDEEKANIVSNTFPDGAGAGTDLKNTVNVS